MTPFIYTDALQSATETSPPSFAANCRQANFARQATLDAFGVHHDKALDQAKFTDHLPGARMRLAPGSWFQSVR